MGKPYRYRLAPLSSVVLMALCHFVLAANDNIELQLGKSSTFYKLKENEWKYFMVKIDEFLRTEDLIIKVAASELFGDPDLYISKV